MSIIGASHPYVHAQLCADEALDRVDEPLSDWAALLPHTRMDGWIKLIQRSAALSTGCMHRVHRPCLPGLWLSSMPVLHPCSCTHLPRSRPCSGVRAPRQCQTVLRLADTAAACTWSQVGAPAARGPPHPERVLWRGGACGGAGAGILPRARDHAQGPGYIRRPAGARPAPNTQPPPHGHLPARRPASWCLWAPSATVERLHAQDSHSFR